MRHTRRGAYLVVNGRWAIDREHARGGMGVVYLGTDLATGDPVAVKRPRESRYQEPSRREAALLARVRVPGVAHLFETGEDEDGPYLVTQWIDGVPFPGDGPLRERCVELLRILARIHGSGVAHGDLKPSNILVVRGGPLTVVDFGVAAAIGPHLHPQEGGGTPTYVAPEVLAGAAPSPRSDLFAVGVLLFQALTGCDPWGSDPSVRLWADAPPVRYLRPDAPEDLARLADALMNRDPAQRPRSAVGALRSLGAVPDLPELPLVGRASLITRLERAIEELEHVDLVGPPGVGRTRLLREATRSRRALWWAPGTPPARLADAEVVVVDGPVDDEGRAALDAHPGAVLGHGPARVDVRPLDVAELQTWFQGPSPILHAAEDGATLLHRASGGLPRAASELLVDWTAAGMALWDGPSVVLEPAYVPLLEQLYAPLADDRDVLDAARDLSANGHFGRACARLELALTEPPHPVAKRARELLRELTLAALSSEDPTVRWRAATLVRASGPVGTTDLEDLLDAASALAKRHPEVVVGLLEGFPSSDPELALAADTLRVEAAFQHGLQPAEALLLRLGEPSGDDARAARWYAWMGLLRYREARFEEAARHHEQSLSRRSSPRQRLNARVNLAMALLEAGDLDRARREGERVVQEAGRSRHAVTEARGWWLVRSAAYRAAEPLPPRLDLVHAVRRLGSQGIAAAVFLNEAAFAWRFGQGELAASLAREAATAFGLDSDAGRLATALGTAAAGDVEGARALSGVLAERPATRLIRQARALARLDPRAWTTPGPPSPRWEVLGPSEVDDPPSTT